MKLFILAAVVLLFANLSSAASPSFAASACPDPEDVSCHTSKNCQGPWGGTIANGNSVYAYEYTTAKSADGCQQELRTCENGHLSGSYEAQYCRVDPGISR